MAVFNKRQVGYIKAIAGVGKHKSFVHRRYDGQLSAGLTLTTANSVIDTAGKSCRYHLVNIHRSAKCVDQRSSNIDDVNNWNVADYTANVNVSNMTMLDCRPVAEGDEGKIDADGNILPDQIPNASVQGGIQPTTERIGSEFFLDKTHIRMRFTMPDFTVSSGKQPHHEYRLIIFRNRKPQASILGEGTVTDPTTAVHGSSFLNHSYDLFNGYVGRPVGIGGWRGRQEFDGHEHYSGMRAGPVQAGFQNTTVGKTAKFPPGEGKRTADDLMTLPLNDADYIVKCDERFFLGPEHGKSHYEKVVTFDWNQRGETFEYDLAQGLEPSFNPLWSILIIGTSNDSVSPNLNILYRATTTIESA